MNRSLPRRPSTVFIKKEAKDLFRGCKANDPQAVSRVYGVTKNTLESPKLTQVQFALAREYGFKRWATLQRCVKMCEVLELPYEDLPSQVELESNFAVNHLPQLDANRYQLARVPSMPDIEPKVWQYVELCKEQSAIPLLATATHVKFALCALSSGDAIEHIKQTISKPVHFVVVDEDALIAMLALAPHREQVTQNARERQSAAAHGAVHDAQSPIRRFANVIIWETIKAGADSTLIDIQDGLAQTMRRVDGSWNNIGPTFDADLAEHLFGVFRALEETSNAPDGALLIDGKHYVLTTAEPTKEDGRSEGLIVKLHCLDEG